LGDVVGVEFGCSQRGAFKNAHRKDFLAQNDREREREREHERKGNGKCKGNGNGERKGP
jgi:hypothetical protein